MQPRTPRTLADRGRYPEEAGPEETTREETPSDDELDQGNGDGPFSFSVPPPTGTQPIAIQRRTHTPAGSITGSINGDEPGMSISETSSSFGGAAMDIDSAVCSFDLFFPQISDIIFKPPGSPLLLSNMPNQNQISHWRYTPPPTTSAVRSNKRKRKCILCVSNAKKFTQKTGSGRPV